MDLEAICMAKRPVLLICLLDALVAMLLSYLHAFTGSAAAIELPINSFAECNGLKPSFDKGRFAL